VAAASDELQDLYAQGRALAARKQYPDAMTAFQTCVALNGTFAPAFFQMARIQANMGQLETAESLCRQALAHNPLLVEAHYTLALIHQEAGCLEAAIAGLKKAVFLDADLVLGHFTLAVLYHQTGMQTHSERHRRHAVRLASALPPETILPGADDLTAGQMLSMANIMM
jgi:chemotaxis protein methyltransferase CheR